MKKIFLILLTTLSISANPYFGIGGTFSNVEAAQIQCKASGMGIIGYKTDTVSPELRYSKGLGGDYDSYGIYHRQQLYKRERYGAYVLTGYGRTTYGDKNYDGVRIGAGINMKKIDFEIVYRAKEKTVSAGIIIKFNTGN